MIHDNVINDYTGFAYVRDGELRNYIPIAANDWYWVYVKKGRVRNSYIKGKSNIIVPRGSRVRVLCYSDYNLIRLYHRVAHNDTALFRYDGNALILWLRLTWRNFLNDHWYHADNV
jgi:hypothetical protein